MLTVRPCKQDMGERRDVSGGGVEDDGPARVSEERPRRFRCT